MGPEFIIATIDQPEPRGVQFSELYNLQKSITHLTLLWDYHSYHVNLVDKVFIINGGRKLQVEQFPGPVRLVYARRNTMMMTGGNPKPLITYLLGMEDDNNQLLLHVSDTGGTWAWKNHR